MRKLASSLIAAALLSLLPLLGAAELPIGTNVEVRLAVPTGSRVSHPGDRVQASVIAPVFAENQLLIPEGAAISGAVSKVETLGFGVKRVNSSLQYDFDSVQLPDGQVFHVTTRVREVETSRERVTEAGTIEGISPYASLSSGASLGISALFVDPEIALPVLAIKFVVARSPDPEIYFPAGTELILELTRPAMIPDQAQAHNAISPLTSTETASVQGLLQRLPQQQSYQEPGRPSDLVNILLLGNRDQIEKAFRAAGWIGEQRHSILAGYRIFHCMVQRFGYSMAPMARLWLNGKPAELAYQKSLDTFSKRHHIRVWKQEQTGFALAAATEDVAYRVRRMHLTHATDPAIDNERAKVVNDLWFTGCVDGGSLIARDSLQVLSDNGRPITTDGRIAVLRLNDCAHARLAPAVSNRRPPSQSRAVAAWEALGKDIARSNPLSVALNAVKSFQISESNKEQQLAMHSFNSQNGRSMLIAAGYQWRRSSVLDAPSGGLAAGSLSAAATPAIDSALDKAVSSR